MIATGNLDQSPRVAQIHQPLEYLRSRLSKEVTVIALTYGLPALEYFSAK